MLSSGGEVMRRERELRSMHESLRMTVAIPFLFGVPPAYEMLRCRDALLGREPTLLSTLSADFASWTPACDRLRTLVEGSPLRMCCSAASCVSFVSRQCLDRPSGQGAADVTNCDLVSAAKA